MRKWQTWACIGSLVAVGLIIAYCSLPLRFDGSSAEAFESSSAAIMQSIPEHLRAGYVQDMRDVVTLTQIKKANVATWGRVQERQEEWMKSLDGKTLAEFRKLAEESRRRMREANGDLRQAIVTYRTEAGLEPTDPLQDFFRTEPDEPEPPRVRGRWASRDEFFRAADAKLVDDAEQEVEGLWVRFRLPDGAQVEEGFDDFDVILPSGAEGSIEKGRWELREQIGFRDLIYLDDAIAIARRDDGQLHLRVNWLVGRWAPFRGEMTADVRSIATFAQIVTSLQRRDPEKESLLEIVNELGISVDPDDAKTPADVKELWFWEENGGDQVSIAALFPNLHTIEAERISVSAIRALEKCAPLRKLVLDWTPFEPRSDAAAALKALVRLRQLEDLEVSCMDHDRPYPAFSNMRNLKRLTLHQAHTIACSQIAECKQLEYLYMHAPFGPKSEFEQLAAIPNLSTLVLEVGLSGGDEIFGAVGGIRSLETLGATLHAIKAGDLELLEPLPRLRNLDIETHSPPDAEVFKDLSRLNISALTLRTSAGGEPYRDECLKHIAQTNSLETITITAGGITQKGLSTLKQLTKLKTLRVQTSDQLSWGDVAELAEQMPNTRLFVWDRDDGWEAVR